MEIKFFLYVFAWLYYDAKQPFGKPEAMDLEAVTYFPSS